MAESGPTAVGRAGSTSVDGRVTQLSIPLFCPVKHVLGAWWRGARWPLVLIGLVELSSVAATEVQKKPAPGSGSQCDQGADEPLLAWPAQLVTRPGDLSCVGRR